MLKLFDTIAYRYDEHSYIEFTAEECGMEIYLTNYDYMRDNYNVDFCFPDNSNEKCEEIEQMISYLEYLFCWDITPDRLSIFFKEFFGDGDIKKGIKKIRDEYSDCIWIHKWEYCNISELGE